jgi:hypothetical protein
MWREGGARNPLSVVDKPWYALRPNDTKNLMSMMIEETKKISREWFFDATSYVECDWDMSDFIIGPLSLVCL